MVDHTHHQLRRVSSDANSRVDRMSSLPDRGNFLVAARTGNGCAMEI